MSNVMLPKYDVKFFKQFDIVLNGLDNLEARRHVNKMCLSAQVPLVESGTAGYLGQVTVHVGSKVECFDCLPKPTQKSYAVCTIRRTPEKPIHCIVWSKEVAFQGIFGDGDLADVGEELSYSNQAPDEFAKMAFKQLFHDNIKQLLVDVEASEEDVWKGREPPKPMDVDSFAEDIALGLDDSWKPPDQHQVLDEHQSAQMFVHSINNLVRERPNLIGSLEFDKDDDAVMQFVAAAANLRSICYGIAPQSFFQAKGMAGNIIHAIATTNAIVSGLIVVQALKLLASGGDPMAGCHSTFIQQYPSNGKIIVPVNCMPPQPDCPSCSLIPLQLDVDTEKVTFEQFVQKIVKETWKFTEFIVDNGSGFLYEEGDFLEEDEILVNSKYLQMPLKDLPGGGIVNNTLVTVTDEGSSLKVPVMVSHCDGPMLLDGSLDQARKSAARDEAKKAEEERKQKEEVRLDDDDDVIEERQASPVEEGPSLKRKREDDEEEVILLDD